MPYWWFMLACDLFIPAAMILMGRWMWKHPPKRINRLSGYRTARSMKNIDTWQFAHAYCGRLWLRMGLIMLLPSALVHLPFYYGSEDAVGVLGIVVLSLQVAVMLSSLLFTEAALKKSFHSDGSRK